MKRADCVNSRRFSFVCIIFFENQYKNSVVTQNMFNKKKGDLMELQGSKTQANLISAFAGESQARNKYTFFADKAKSEGYEQIAEIFELTAKNEKAHAEIWFKLLNGGIQKTAINLQSAAEGENYEHINMYPEFAKVAREEGFDDIARLFDEVAEIEKEHEERFKKLLDNVNQSLVFSKDGESIWVCRNCGNVVVGKQAPLVCPVCSYPQAYFEIECKNY